MNSTVHKKIYGTVLEVLAKRQLAHNALIEEAISLLYGGIDTSGQVGDFTEIRGLVGSVVSEMKSDGVILYDSGLYSVGVDGDMPLRMERCEKEIVFFLTLGAKSKAEIRSRMREVFKTDKTKSDHDDKILYNYNVVIEKRRIKYGTR